jgi:membrane-associated protein
MFDLFNIPQFIHSYGYIGIFIIVFLESGVFPPLPGDSLLFTAGLFASAAGLNIVLLLVAIFLATLFGALLGYEVGVYLIRLQKYSWFRKILKQQNIDKANAFFAEYGRLAITFARFIPFMRTLVPIAAGVAHMDYKAFLRYSILGSALWSSLVTLLGYFLGRAFPAIKDYLWVVALLIVFVSVIPFIIEFTRRKVSKRKKN